MSIKVDRFNSDPDRAEIEAFFATHIDDANRFPLHLRSTDPLKGFPSFILAVRDSNGLAGALHAGAAAEQIQAYVSHGLPPREVDKGIRDHAMIYSLAVREEVRRAGIARALVNELLDQLHGFTRLYGVTGPRSSAFYHACGFTVLPPGAAIALHIGRAQVNIPLSGKDSWFSMNL
ncbi:GNAT family N-acetyltransferase [Pseudarthrobacter sp. SSS035]|uniref:GNAT family N-acetyltransferase n=1 Tax=Pseudarthrobacter sp. SSS035 TaxID=2931399 RepID=UPI00200BF334|nr:GNAT family N-acetyltransferase [Pseudarthrobacter sp. SSS035]